MSSVNVTHTIYKRAFPCIYRRYAAPAFLSCRAFHSHKPLLQEPTFTQKVKSTVAGTAEAIKEGIHDLSSRISGATGEKDYSDRDLADTDKTYASSENVGDKGITDSAKEKLHETSETVKQAASDLKDKASTEWQDLKNKAYETKGRLKEKSNESSTSSSGNTVEEDAHETKGRVKQAVSDVSSDVQEGLNDANNKMHEWKGRAKEKAGI